MGRDRAGKSPTTPVSGKDHRTTKPTEKNSTPQPRPIQPDRPHPKRKH